MPYNLHIYYSNHCIILLSPSSSQTVIFIDAMPITVAINPDYQLYPIGFNLKTNDPDPCLFRFPLLWCSNTSLV